MWLYNKLFLFFFEVRVGLMDGHMYTWDIVVLNICLSFPVNFSAYLVMSEEYLYLSEFC